MSRHQARNVLGEPLIPCCHEPMTGFYRDGFCHTGVEDIGEHVVCAVLTDDFLQFSREQGNDLTTPRPEFGFAGLQAGSAWCLCVTRWAEAFRAGMAPPVKLEATHEKALERVPLEALQRHALQ